MDRFWLVFIGIVVAICIGAVLLAKSAYADTYTIEGKVEKKWIDFSKEGSHYLVRLYGGRMLEVNRNPWYGGDEYNPDIIYSDIAINSTYRFTCWGWQYSWGSIYWYPNVIKAEKLP